MHRAILLVFPLLTVIGSGCRSEPAPSPLASCQPDTLGSTQEFCAHATVGPCKEFASSYAKPCADGCFLQTCGREIVCEERGEACGGSCDSPDSGEFWLRLLTADVICRNQKRLTQPDAGQCIIEETEKRCPELAGTRWAARFPEIQR